MALKKKEDPQAIIRKRVAKITTEPGVYRWLDDEKNVLYVGKAKNLRNRMKTYVQDGKKHSPWTEIMVRQIADFDVTVVRNELEALILEANLIKQMKPKYNIMLKDDKGYAYVRVSVREKYPRVDVVRRLEEDGAKYFGPFLGAWDIKQTLEMLDGILKFRACKTSLDTLNNPAKGEANLKGGTPCLDYQIGKCCGLCIGAVSETDYRERIAEVEKFFRGNYASVKKKAEETMKVAASEKKFEIAARIRDVIRFIEEQEQKQVISDTTGDDADVFGIALRQGKIQAILLRQRDGKLIEQVAFALKGEAESAADALAQFLPQYYEDTQDIPDTIIVGEELAEKKILEEWLRTRRGKVVRMLVPERGKKSKLLEMAERNAQQKVDQQFAAWEAEAQKVESALAELAGLVRLSAPPRRVEGYDISHLGGTATVASMVVFLNGKPKREHYRSFNMRTVKEGDVDDYKSLAEAVRRRLRYLTDDVKTVTERLKKEGIEIGKARKSEQLFLEETTKDWPDRLGHGAVDYKNFLVARKGDAVVAFAQMFSCEGTRVIRTVWVHKDERGKKIGRLLVRKLLAGMDKGKAYVVIDPKLEEYYAELGFRHIESGPEILAKLHAACSEEFPERTNALTLMYESKQNKIDASFGERPDLMLIDGGKGQLSAVFAVLKDMNVDIPLASLAKREEEIFLPGEQVSLLVQKDSPARFLLQRIRDESHRFANAKREKRLDLSLFHSKLDEVPGIGESTKQALLKKFGSVDFVLAADDKVLGEILNQTQLKSLREKFPKA